MRSSTNSGGSGCTDREFMMRACAWEARLSSATLRTAICSRRAWMVSKGEVATVSRVEGDGRSMYTTVASPSSLLVSLRLVLSLRLLARSTLGLLLSVSVDALVSVDGIGVARSGEGGGGGGGGGGGDSCGSDSSGVRMLGDDAWDSCARVVVSDGGPDDGCVIVCVELA